ncbi:hypothetical protein J4Q44_G00034660 [Coregonus suidteri]|uniref:Uncharacterized protein n=1 Tax=Coregonus suidteri TaxID=861788 RepID=A0AAN8MNR5_9TELE
MRRENNLERRQRLPSLTPPPVSTTPLLGFGAQFKKPEGAPTSLGFKVEPKALGSSSFAGSSDTTSTDTSSSAGFKFSSSTEGFRFGAAAASTPAAAEGKKDEALSMGAGFKFGVSGGISFGTAAAVSTESKPSDGGFSFGLSKPATHNHLLYFKPSCLYRERQWSFYRKQQQLICLGSWLRPSLLPWPHTRGQHIRESQEKDQDPFTFGKPDEKEASMSPKHLPSPFGKLADDSETPAAKAPKPSFSFGQSSTDATASKPAFGFMATPPLLPPPLPPVCLGPPAPLPQPLSPAPSTYLFGQSASSEATPAKSFLFGPNQDSLPAPAASLNPGPAQPFLFGSGPNTAAPSFTFGAAAPSTASSTAPSAAHAPFVFSPASSTGFGSGQAPTFGQGISQPNAPPDCVWFSNTVPLLCHSLPALCPCVFGQQANSTPAFGSSTPATPGGGFQFGGNSAFGTSSNSTGVFAFGGAPGGSPAPSATPSMAPQPSAPGGGFNFAAAPTFIGSTKSTTFTAAPAGQNSIARRKIKTAVRRKK